MSRRAVYDALRAGRIARLPGGKIDAAAADRAWTANTLAHVGGKTRPKGNAAGGRAVATGEAEARRLLSRGGGDVLSFADARRARELVKLSCEALELRRMQGSLVEVDVVSRRVFHLFRLVRDRLDAWVSRAGPLVAGAAKADEGAVWRAMAVEMKKLEAELAATDLEVALATEDDAQDEGTGEEPTTKASAGAVQR